MPVHHPSLCRHRPLPRSAAENNTLHPVPVHPLCLVLQLRRALGILGTRMSREEVEVMMAEIDSNNDGEVRAAAMRGAAAAAASRLCCCCLLLPAADGSAAAEGSPACCD